MHIIKLRIKPCIEKDREVCLGIRNITEDTTSASGSKAFKSQCTENNYISISVKHLSTCLSKCWQKLCGIEMSRLASWGWGKHLSPCLNQHLLEQIQSPGFPLIACIPKPARTSAKSALRADKSTLPTVSVGLLPSGLVLLSLWAYVTMHYPRNTDTHFRGFLGRNVSATRCFGSCPQRNTVLMIWPENEEIVATLPVKDPFTETRAPCGQRPRVVSNKKSSELKLF